MAKLKFPFELEKPSSNEYVTQASEIGLNGQPLDEVLLPLDSISKESTQSEEQAIIYETDGGTQVGKIDANGADFINLKRGGQQVARMSDLPTVPILDTSIGDNPSNTNVPTSKAVVDYVDTRNPTYPITKTHVESANEEIIYADNTGTTEYAKVSPNGVWGKKLSFEDSNAQTRDVEEEIAKKMEKPRGMSVEETDNAEDKIEIKDINGNISLSFTPSEMIYLGILRVDTLTKRDGSPIIASDNEIFDIPVIYYKDQKSIVNNAAKSKVFSFLFFSDIHGSMRNMDRIVAMANGYGSTLLDAVINAGDTVQGNISVGGLNSYNTRVTNCDIPVLTAVGNHDVWKSYGSDQIEGTQEMIYNEMMPTVISQAVVTQPENAATNYLSYYFKDFGDIRVIVLDSEQARRRPEYKTSELQWFTNVALDTDKKVVCIIHHPFSYRSQVNGVVTFNEDCTFTTLRTDSPDHVIADVDFVTAIDTFINNGGEFIAWFGGHTHFDAFGNMPAHNYQPIFTINTARGGDTASGFTLDTNRDDYTKNYDCFDYIAIDTSRGTINRVRFGNDSDCYLRYKHTMCYDYKNHRLVSNN